MTNQAAPLSEEHFAERIKPHVEKLRADMRDEGSFITKLGEQPSERGKRHCVSFIHLFEIRQVMDKMLEVNLDPEEDTFLQKSGTSRDELIDLAIKEGEINAAAPLDEYIAFWENRCRPKGLPDMLKDRYASLLEKQADLKSQRHDPEFSIRNIHRKDGEGLLLKLALR